MYFVLMSPWHSYAPENLRLRSGSISFITIVMVLTPVLRWLPARAVKTPVTPYGAG